MNAARLLLTVGHLVTQHYLQVYEEQGVLSINRYLRRKIQVIKYIFPVYSYSCPIINVVLFICILLFSLPKFLYNELLLSEKVRRYISEKIVAAVSQKINSSMPLHHE